MVSFISGLILALSTFGVVNSAPVSTLDTDSLLQNGIDAQKLNTIFQNLRSTDTCNSGDIACVESATAQCVDGTWERTECPSTQSCFVLPSIRERGSFITCTSERSAASIIQATGATGGITGSEASESAGTPSSGATTPTDLPPTRDDTSAEGNSDVEPVTITLTLPAPTGPTTITLPPTTVTISPDDVPIILSSIATASQVVTVGPPSPVTTIAAPEPTFISTTPEPVTTIPAETLPPVDPLTTLSASESIDTPPPPPPTLIVLPGGGGTGPDAPAPEIPQPTETAPPEIPGPAETAISLPPMTTILLTVKSTATPAVQ
ncbi:hypothetical protein AX16_010997 [Volvariella volvacea WC 439]|nr:hypothetical protein AX16_010997 [Volvariella volvacea WC 439]